MKMAFILSALCSALINCQAALEVKKVVIPAAGFGTRFLPITKAIPKEMIPLENKPAIQIAVEEAMSSGLCHIVPIISKHKQAIRDHFDPEKSTVLRSMGKYHMIADNDKKFNDVKFSFLNQKIQLGLGHAVLMAEDIIGDEYFGVILPDEIIFNDEPALAQLIEVAKRENASVIAVQEVPKERVSSYGVIKVREELGGGLYEIADLVEKPSIEQAPSNLAIVGRYVLSPKVFASLNKLMETHTTGELQLTDAIAHMMQESGERVIAYKVQGERHDIGVPQGWIKAIIASALHNPRYAEEITRYIASLSN